VTFDRRAHNPILLEAQLDQDCPPVPWLANHRVHFVTPDQLGEPRRSEVGGVVEIDDNVMTKRPALGSRRTPISTRSLVKGR
jgi:hypothetical protein